MREFVRRTSRALPKMRLRNFAEIHATNGRMASTTSASGQCITSMATAMPQVIVTPQMTSRNAQARMSVRRLQSEVRRAISQPVGR